MSSVKTLEMQGKARKKSADFLQTSGQMTQWKARSD